MPKQSFSKCLERERRNVYSVDPPQASLMIYASIIIAPKAHFPSHAAIENGHVRDIYIDVTLAAWGNGSAGWQHRILLNLVLWQARR